MFGCELFGKLNYCWGWFLLCEISYSLVECGLLDSIFSWVFVDDDILFCFLLVVFSRRVDSKNRGWRNPKLLKVQIAMSLVDRYILGTHHTEKHLQLMTHHGLSNLVLPSPSSTLSPLPNKHSDSLPISLLQF